MSRYLKTKRKCFWLVSFIFIVFMVSVISSQLLEGKAVSTHAVQQEGGKKFRIAYCETGPYANYAGTFYYIVQGLAALGGINDIHNLPYNWGQTDAKPIWDWLSSHDVGGNIEFVQDAFYSIEGDHAVTESLLKRLVEKKDIDLVIVMGTLAGQAVANNKHTVPVMVFSTSNAVQSGIIQSVESSGNPHVWAHMDPNRYRQQLDVFYDVFQFKKLGFVYDPSPAGRAFAAVDDIYFMAKGKGFDAVGYEVQGTKNEQEQERFFLDLLAVHRKMASEVDAVYYTITPSPGLKPEKLREALAPFYERNIPVFSQLGDEEVKLGALMSIARSDFSGVGLFGAEQMLQILQGTAADKLPQVFVDAPSIAINLEAAKKINYKPPFTIMLVADKIFGTGQK